MRPAARQDVALLVRLISVPRRRWFLPDFSFWFVDFLGRSFVAMRVFSFPSDSCPLTFVSFGKSCHSCRVLTTLFSFSRSFCICQSAFPVRLSGLFHEGSWNSCVPLSQCGIVICDLITEQKLESYAYSVFFFFFKEVLFFFTHISVTFIEIHTWQVTQSLSLCFLIREPPRLWGDMFGA